MIKKVKRLPNNFKFLFAVLLVYLVVGVINFSFLKQVSENFFHLVREILPMLGFVFLVMFITNLFIKPDFIKKHLGESSGIKSWFYVLVGSIFISGPPYILFPYFGELKKQGMSASLIATFLSNRNVQVIFLPIMVYYFGLSFTVIISTYIVIFSIINGLLIGKLVKE